MVHEILLKAASAYCELEFIFWVPISVGKKAEFNDFIFLFRFSGLSTFSYRNKFDLALPSYTILQEENVKANSRNINLVVLQGSEVHDKLKPLIGNLKNKPGKIIQIIFC